MEYGPSSCLSVHPKVVDHYQCINDLLKSKMPQMPYKAIRQMYTKYKQRPKFYVDWQSFLTHDDINYLQVGWSLGLFCLSRVKKLVGSWQWLGSTFQRSWQEWFSQQHPAHPDVWPRRTDLPTSRWKLLLRSRLESPEASRDRHLDRQRPLVNSFDNRERPLATGIYVAGGRRRLVWESREALAIVI